MKKISFIFCSVFVFLFSSCNLFNERIGNGEKRDESKTKMTDWEYYNNVIVYMDEIQPPSDCAIFRRMVDNEPEYALSPSKEDGSYFEIFPNPNYGKDVDWTSKFKYMFEGLWWTGDINPIPGYFNSNLQGWN